METIFALSSGSPPAGIAVIRVTGPEAGIALEALAGSRPTPRVATRAHLHDTQGVPLDDGLVLWFPGPASVTGEDVAEFHVHGGRAVVTAVQAALGTLPGLRPAKAGEFTRRAFANGRMDLAQAEGLADLLAAETELQRRAAIAVAGGNFSRQVAEWCEEVLTLSAEVEAALDFDEEDLVTELSEAFRTRLGQLMGELSEALAGPQAEALREGYRVALAGPPNAGKSTLFNALVQSDAAIVTDLAGTTRDVLTRSIAMDGIPFTMVDMAGLREATTDPVEAIGIARAEAEIADADLVLWLGPEGEGPEGCWEVQGQADRADRPGKADPDFRVSALTGSGMVELADALIEQARTAMPKPGEAALNQRQHALLTEAHVSLEGAQTVVDPLLIAEALRLCRVSFDALVGRTSTEDVLDALFSRFCIGK